MDIGGRIHSRFRPSTSDTFALPNRLLLPVTFPVAACVLMKQAGRSHEAKQTTDRRRAA
jgi:hypothetical protein